MSATPVLEKPSIESFKSSVRGEVILPGDANYDSARAIYNGMIDRRPAVIVRSVDVADVIAAVNYGRESALELAIRGGGHNVAGFATTDGGLVIDLSRMKGIRVDPIKRVVRAEGGCTWGDLDHATHPFGLAAAGGIVSTTGIAGLSLGGGIGYLARSFGLSCDNLLSADVVLANGQLVTASPTEHQDLYWAVRGGGGNFGVVTSFEFKLHPVGTVFGGPVLYPLEKAREVLRFYRDFMQTAPEELSVFFAYLIVPPGPPFPQNLHNKTLCGLVACYVGPLGQAEAITRPIRQFGPPLLDGMAPMPFPALNSAFDALAPKGLQNYWKADFVRDLSDEIIEQHVRYGPGIPTIETAVHIYPVSGAVHRLANDATAFNYRDANYVHVIAPAYPNSADTPKIRQWVREYYEALHPYSAGGTYVNFLDNDEGPGRVRDSYRGNFERLRAIKRTYDPTNLFHLNQNIPPAD